MNMKQKYRITKVVRGDGLTYYIPEKRVFLKWKSLLEQNEPVHTRYVRALETITLDLIGEIDYQLIEDES